MAPSSHPSSLLGRRKRLAIGAALVLALPAVVACNSIIGLNDFDKGQCPGARCTDDGSFPDQISMTDGGSDAPEDVQADARGADPVSWAKWPMPNYGEGGAGEPPHPQMLTLVGDTVTDGITKLAWHATIVPGDYSADQVVLACQSLAPGSWRAPKRIELVTLLDYGRPTQPFVDVLKFKDIKNYTVWTTSEVRPYTPPGKVFVPTPNQSYWVVNFSTGAVETLPTDPSTTAKVLCVKAK